MTGKLIRICAALIAFSGFMMLFGCKTTLTQKPLRIALSSGSENYIKWVHHGDTTAEIIDMKGIQVDSALKLLSTCDGIVFTGGEDVVPSYYGKSFDSIRCESNPGRDSLEFALIEEAIKLKIPVLGVCRGQQILNVALGGTLIVDIPSDHPGKVIHRCEDYIGCVHSVKIVKNSRLQFLSKADTGTVTTNHHQAIEKPAPGIRITAWSADSIPEAMEWADPEKKSFFMAVQWHPERMDTKNPLSMPLMNAFLQASEAGRNQK
jgi:putative glutamine amidotransferase